MQTVALTTLGSDKDCAFGGTATIEDNSRSTLEEGNLVDFSWQHVVYITWHTIHKDECVTLAPQ